MAVSTLQQRHSSRLRHLAPAVIVCAGLVTVSAATAVAAGPGSHSVPSTTPGGTSVNPTSARIVHLVAHETQNKFISQGGLGDVDLFRGVLDDATGTTQIGTFAGTLTSVSSNDATNLATVDLQLPGGQITVQGFFFGNQSPIVHAINGGTGSYIGARGEFAFTHASPGVLDMTLTLLGEGEQ
jgi:hypothetical protein